MRALHCTVETVQKIATGKARNPGGGMNKAKALLDRSGRHLCTALVAVGAERYGIESDAYRSNVLPSGKATSSLSPPEMSLRGGGISGHRESIIL